MILSGSLAVVISLATYHSSALRMKQHRTTPSDVPDVGTSLAESSDETDPIQKTIGKVTRIERLVKPQPMQTIVLEGKVVEADDEAVGAVPMVEAVPLDEASDEAVHWAEAEEAVARAAAEGLSLQPSRSAAGYRGVYTARKRTGGEERRRRVRTGDGEWRIGDGQRVWRQGRQQALEEIAQQQQVLAQQWQVLAQRMIDTATQWVAKQLAHEAGQKQQLMIEFARKHFKQQPALDEQRQQQLFETIAQQQQVLAAQKVAVGREMLETAKRRTAHLQAGQQQQIVSFEAVQKEQEFLQRLALENKRQEQALAEIAQQQQALAQAFAQEMNETARPRQQFANQQVAQKQLIIESVGEQFVQRSERIRESFAQQLAIDKKFNQPELDAIAKQQQVLDQQEQAIVQQMLEVAAQQDAQQHASEKQQAVQKKQLAETVGQQLDFAALEASTTFELQPQGAPWQMASNATMSSEGQPQGEPGLHGRKEYYKGSE